MFGLFKSAEKRSSVPHNPTLIPSAASFVGTISGEGTAAIETGIGLIQRGLAMSSWEPTGAATSPPSMASLAGAMTRALALQGEFVGLIEIEDGAIKICPSHSPTITGGHLESTWSYTLTLSSPSETRTLRVPAERVVHVRWQTSPERSWQGISPLTAAGLTADILAKISRTLANESGASSGYVLPTPSAFFSDTKEAASFFNSIKTIAGRLLPFRRFGEVAVGTPSGEYRQTRIGFDAPQAALTLEEAASQAILRAMGIPPGLVQRAEGSATREALKVFMYQTLLPLGRIISHEVGRKLGMADLTLNFDALLSVDIQARARALHALTTAGLSPSDAMQIAGMQGEAPS